MDDRWLSRIIQAAAITLTLAAVCQELEKPPEERKWHGKVANLVPYDFRLPTIEKLMETHWNPYDSRIIVPELIGVGWAINFYALLEKLRLIVQGDVSEESFLMPTQSIKELMTEPTEEE